MTITPDAKKFVIVFGLSLVLFFLLKPGTDKKPKKLIMSPEEKKKTANIVADAYIAAIMDNQPASALEELNRISEKEYGMRAYQKASDKKVYVKDMNGADIKLS